MEKELGMEIEKFTLSRCKDFQFKLHDFINNQKIDKVGIIISALYIEILDLQKVWGISDTELFKLMLQIKKIFNKTT